MLFRRMFGQDPPHRYEDSHQEYRKCCRCYRTASWIWVDLVNRGDRPGGLPEDLDKNGGLDDEYELGDVGQEVLRQKYDDYFASGDDGVEDDAGEDDSESDPEQDNEQLSPRSFELAVQR